MVSFFLAVLDFLFVFSFSVIFLQLGASLHSSVLWFVALPPVVLSGFHWFGERLMHFLFRHNSAPFPTNLAWTQLICVSNLRACPVRLRCYFLCFLCNFLLVFHLVFSTDLHYISPPVSSVQLAVDPYVTLFTLVILFLVLEFLWFKKIYFISLSENFHLVICCSEHGNHSNCKACLRALLPGPRLLLLVQCFDVGWLLI